MTKPQQFSVLFINHPTQPFAFTRMSSEAYPQLGLAYMASFLRENGIKVSLIDANALQMSYSALENEIKRIQPGLVGISSTTPTILPAIEVAKLAKKLGCKVVMGGVHPTVFHDSLIKEDFVDIVVKGEGEQTMLEIAQGKKLSKIDGITFKENGIVRINKDRCMIADLDSIPFPAWDLLPIEKYRITVADEKPCVTMLASRGCFAKCIHCSSQIIFKNCVRTRSAKNVVDEMEMLAKKYGVKYIYFIDYTFVVKKEITKEICEEILKRKLKIKWWAETRANIVDKELLQRMKLAGCRTINFGVESGNQQILNNIKRGMTLGQIRQAVKWAKEVGLRISTTFMLGCLGETMKTANQTIDLAIELDANEAQFSIYTPYPGTEYYRLALKQGIIKKDAWQDYTFFSAKQKPTPFRSKNLSSEELQYLFKKAYKKFYFRPKFIIRKIPEILNPLQFKRAIVIFKELLKMS